MVYVQNHVWLVLHEYILAIVFLGEGKGLFAQSEELSFEISEMRTMTFVFVEECPVVVILPHAVLRGEEKVSDTVSEVSCEDLES